MSMNTEDMMSQLRLARVYVPIQQFGATYSPMQALQRGTLFPELDIPFVQPAGLMEVDGK